MNTSCFYHFINLSIYCRITTLNLVINQIIARDKIKDIAQFIIL